MTEDAALAEAEVWADDPDDTDELYTELRGVVGITVQAAPASAEPGEQGATLDVLTVALSSGAITAFLQIIKTIAEAKGPKFVLKIRRGRNQLRITTDDLDEIEPAIRRLFGGR
jgi:Effector Associated Constant Component 1